MGNDNPKQEQAFKQDFTMAQKQMMYNEMHQKLFAEIEVLFKLEGGHIGHDYQKFRDSKDKTHSAVIANIENFLRGIECFNMMAKATQLPLKSPVPNWNFDALAEYYHKIPEGRVSKQVIYHYLKCAETGTLSSFTPELAEKVKPTAERIAMRNEYLSNPENVTRFMHSVHQKEDTIIHTNSKGTRNHDPFFEEGPQHQAQKNQQILPQHK